MMMKSGCFVELFARHLKPSVVLMLICLVCAHCTMASFTDDTFESWATEISLEDLKHWAGEYGNGRYKYCEDDNYKKCNKDLLGKLKRFYLTEINKHIGQGASDSNTGDYSRKLQLVEFLIDIPAWLQIHLNKIEGLNWKKRFLEKEIATLEKKRKADLKQFYALPMATVEMRASSDETRQKLCTSLRSSRKLLREKEKQIEECKKEIETVGKNLVQYHKDFSKWLQSSYKNICEQRIKDAFSLELLEEWYRSKNEKPSQHEYNQKENELNEARKRRSYLSQASRLTAQMAILDVFKNSKLWNLTKEELDAKKAEVLDKLHSIQESIHEQRKKIIRNFNTNRLGRSARDAINKDIKKLLKKRMFYTAEIDAIDESIPKVDDREWLEEYIQQHGKREVYYTAVDPDVQDFVLYGADVHNGGEPPFMMKCLEQDKPDTLRAVKLYIRFNKGELADIRSLNVFSAFQM